MDRHAVIWDLDGVIVDTGESHFRAWVSALAEWEIPFGRGDFARVFGMNNRDTLTEVLGRPPEPQELATIAGRKEHLFRLEAPYSVQPLPGALRLLEELGQAEWLQALASSAPHANIDLIVDKIGIRDRFEAILSGADLPAGKPDPALFLQAAERLELQPEQCVIIEDSVAGVEAANRAGMFCVAVTTTRPRAALVLADRVVESLVELEIADLAILIAGQQAKL